jgi:hypothetical protein
MQGQIAQGERGSPRLRRAAAWTRPSNGALALLALSLIVGACGSERAEEPKGVHSAGAEHEAEMVKDGEAKLQASLAAVRDKPPVITLDGVAQAVGADTAARARLVRPVAALNAALVQLAELHRTHDSAQAVDALHALDQRAYPLHMQADAYESEIDRVLNVEQHGLFHSYLRDRSAAAGLPLDESHGPGDIGTAGNTNTVAHPSGKAHRDDVRPNGAAPSTHTHPDSGRTPGRP